LTGKGRARKDPPDGAVAQMGERCNRTAEVRGSNPLSSTNQPVDIEGLSVYLNVRDISGTCAPGVHKKVP
jgi:hypothetical protein